MFSHNDLLSGNLLFQTKASLQIPVRQYGDITIIDYEYAGYNPRACDLGNHFCGTYNCTSIYNPLILNKYFIHIIIIIIIIIIINTFFFFFRIKILRIRWF